MDALWKQIDILVTPTTPTTAPLAEEESLTINGVKENTRMASTRLVRGINCVGEPALSMPCGNDENGLPIGLQMIAPPFAEARLLQVARTLEGMLQRQI
jgi:aspartyl-tRNA(Asn)/glutamyl-tRNA(Gln) amidotransferase subunit A